MIDILIVSSIFHSLDLIQNSFIKKKKISTAFQMHRSLPLFPYLRLHYDVVVIIFIYKNILRK